MRPGTPGFVPERLTEARQEKGLRQATLADLATVTRQAIGQFERGGTTPSPDVLRRLALVLGVRPGYFLLPARPPTREPFFRSRASMTKTARLMGDRKLQRLGDFYQLLQERLVLPAPNFPEPPAATSDPFFMEDDEIEYAAQSLRRFWSVGSGPISNVVRLLENNGVVVTRVEMHEKTMDSWSRWDDEPNPLVILNSDKASAVRSRFDAAHELGHLLLHRLVPDSYWSVPQGVEIREHQAHYFASAFLLPEESFVADVGFPSLERFKVLKPKWRVSIQTMLSRATTLRVVGPELAEIMWRTISKWRWKTREPWDDEWDAEEPRLLSRAFEVLYEHDPTAPTAITEAMEIDSDILIRLTGVSQSAFESDIAVIPFRTRA